MDFPTLGLNFDLTEVVQGIRTLRQGEQAVLRFGDANERAAAKVEAANRRMVSSARRGADEAARAGRGRGGKTVEELQYERAVAAINGRMAFSRRMSAQRIAEERREAAEVASTQSAIQGAAERTTSFRIRMARQRAREEAAAERSTAAAAQASQTAERQAAAQTLQFRSRMTQQRVREAIAAERAEASSAQQTAQFQMRMARQRASEERATERRIAAERQAAERAARQEAQQTFQFQRRMTQQRIREEAAAARASAAAARAAAAAGGGGGIGGIFGGLAGMGRFGGALNSLNFAVGRLRNTFLNARFVVASFLGALAVGPIVQMVDAMTALDARIGIYANRASDVPYTFEALYQAAQTARQPLEAMGVLYSRLAPMAGQLGKSQLDLVRITETVAKSFAITGATAQEAASSTQQLAQALASNRLGGDELRSLAENAPVLMNEIARALDMNVGQFIKWAQAGNANAAVVIGAIEQAKERVDQMFAAMPVTIAQSVTVVGNALTHLIDRVNQMTGTSERLAGFIANFATFLEAESTINGVANAVDAVTKTFEVMTNVVSGLIDMLPALAAGFATFAAIAAATAAVNALTKAFVTLQIAAAIAGTRMVTMQGIMAVTATAARGLLAAVGGVAGLLTGGVVLAVVAAVASFTTLRNSQAAVAQSAEMLQSAQEGAIGAVQRAISFSQTYGLSTEKLDQALQGMGNSSTVAAAATDETSKAHARAQTQALARANAERVLTQAILTRAAAEAGKAADEAEKALRGGWFGIGGLESQEETARLRLQASRNQRMGGRGTSEAERRAAEDLATARDQVDNARATAAAARQQQADMAALAAEFRKPLGLEDITVPTADGGAAASAAADKAGKGLDGAINRMAKLREEVEGLNAQIAALLRNPLDPLADFAARIAAAGDEAAAQYTSGKAAEAGFAEQARSLASQKEELEIRLQLLQTMTQERRAAADEQRQLANTTAARQAQNAVMTAFWASSDRSAAGYAEALRASTEAEIRGAQTAEALRIARQFGVDSLDQIAEAYQRATGASEADAQALEAHAKATAAAVGETIRLTRAEEDAAAAAAAGIGRQQQIADTNAYADALARGTAAMAEYNRQLRIRQAIEANRGLNPAEAARQVDDQISAEDRVAREERRRAFEDELRLATMTAEQRDIEAEAMRRVADAIARGSSDAAELSVEAQRTRVAYENAALAVARMKGQIKNDIREAFAETGKVDFTSLKENLKRKIREAVYDALLAKPIDLVVNAVVNVITKGLEALLSKIMGADGGSGGPLGGLGDMFKSGVDRFGEQLKGFMEKLPRGLTTALKGIGAFAGRVGAGYSIGTGIADMVGLEGNGRSSQGWMDMAGSAIGTMLGGPIGGAIGAIASRLLGSIFSDKKRPLAITALEVRGGQFQSRGTQAYDGGPREEIDAAGRDMAKLLNQLAKAFDLDLSKAEGLTTLFGWTAGENTKALGGEGFFGGALRETQNMRGMTLDQIKGSALGRGVDLSQVKDAEEAIDRILRETLIRVGDAVGDAFTEAEKAVIRAAESLEDAAATLVAARQVESNLERALLRFTNPTEFAMANLRDQQIARRAGIKDFVDQGLIAADRLPGIEALLQELERNEIAEALANLADGANGAAASLKQIQEAQEKIRAYVEGLRTGNLSPLAPAAQLNLSRERFDDLLGRAQAGDLEALQTITDSSSEFLAAARQFYGSSEAYAAIFDTVYNALDALGNQEFADPLISTIEEQVQRLIDAINAGFGLFANLDDDDVETPPVLPPAPPVTPPDVPSPPPVIGGGGGGGGGGGWDTGFGGGRPPFDRELLDRVDDLQSTLANVGAAIVDAQQVGSRKVADATLDQATLNGALKGGKVSQARAA